MKNKEQNWIIDIKKLLDYVEKNEIIENGKRWVPDWDDFSQQKYYISYFNNMWNYSLYDGGNRFGVYMSLDCASELVKKLTDKKVKLF